MTLEELRSWLAEEIEKADKEAEARWNESDMWEPWENRDVGRLEGRHDALKQVLNNLPKE